MTEATVIIVQSRSKACATCITRKTKCDRTSPACSQCIRDGWDCPGYAKVWKKKEVKSRKPRPRYDKEWLPGQDSKREFLELQPNGVKVAIRRKSQLPSISPTQIDLFSLPTVPSNSPLLVQLINHLDSTKPPGLVINNLGSFFPFIPQRLGHCKALDDAVQCICTAYSAFLRFNGSVIEQDCRAYYQALRSLRLACQDKNDVLSSNVLCAAVLLSWYEILADNLDYSWIIHVGGCATLVQLRGPARHKSGFDHALLKAEEGSMTIDSFLKHKPCFLDTQSWRSVADQPTELSSSRSSAVGPTNRTLARLSTLIYELDSLSSLFAPEAEETIIAICNLRQDVKLRLAANLEKIPEIYTPIICTKDAYYLLLIDTTLMKLLSAPNLPSSILPLILGTIPCFSFQTRTISHIAFWGFLERELSDHLEIFQENLVLASKATPFPLRKMLFWCRAVGEERRRRESVVHPVWIEVEKAIQEVRDKGWVERAMREAVQF